MAKITSDLFTKICERVVSENYSGSGNTDGTTSGAIVEVPNLNVETLKTLSDVIDNALRALLKSNMESKQAEAYLSSQARKKGSQLSSEHAQLLKQYWVKHREQIVSHALMKSCIHPRLTDTKIAITSTMESSSGSNTTTMAIVHLALASSNQSTQEKVTFCADHSMLEKLTLSMKRLDTYLRHVSEQDKATA